LKELHTLFRKLSKSQDPMKRKKWKDYI